ncbi:MAG: ATP-binding protein [Pseudomonadota bacterium]
MGLFTALRWLGTQTSEQAQLTLHMNGLDVDIDIPPEAGIAVFRTAQEAMSNIVKHANGTRLTIEAGVDRTEDGTRLTIEIADDGRGMPEDAGRRVGSHGLKAMRFRMESVDGTLEIAPGTPRGTSIVFVGAAATGRGRGSLRSGYCRPVWMAARICGRRSKSFSLLRKCSTPVAVRARDTAAAHSSSSRWWSGACHRATRARRSRCRSSAAGRG